MHNLRVAIISPGVDVYSETFILNHKQKLKGDVFFYYDGAVPKKLDRKNSPSEISLSAEEEALTLDRDNIRRLYQLKNSLVNNKINVVLCEYGTSAAASLPAIEALGLPLVVHFHGYDAYEQDVIEKHKDQYAEVFQYASRVVAVSNAMKQQLISIGCPAEKVVCAPCGAREAFFNIEPTKRSKQFLLVGRFVQKKAPQNTLLAFNEVVREYPQVRLVMIGEGPLLDVCKRMASYSGIANKVSFMGAVSSDTVVEEMKKSLALVQHSVTALNGDSEGTPVAVLEAGAASLPVVATKHAGIVETVVDGETGLLVEEHDIIGMAKAMKRLLDDPAQAARMGSKARAHIRKNFSDDRNIQKLDDAIEFAYRSHKIHKPDKDTIRIAALRDTQYKNRLLQQENQKLRDDIIHLKESYRWKIGNKIVTTADMAVKLPKRIIHGRSNSN